MTQRTVRPGDEEWKGAIGQQPSSLEAAVTAAQFPQAQPTSSATGAAGTLTYPQKLILDLTGYLHALFSNFNFTLPQSSTVIQDVKAKSPQNIYNQLEYVHGKILLDTFGLEGLTIENKFEADSYHQRSGRTMSEFKLHWPSATKAREYLTALFGPELLNSPLASDFAELPLEEIIDLSNLPVLLPHLSENGIRLVQALGKPIIASPFESPYFIIMELPPAARLLTARAMRTAYAKGTIQPPSNEFLFRGHIRDLEIFQEVRENLTEAKFAIPDSIMQAEAQRLSIQGIAPYKQAYSHAWQSLQQRLR